jgi:hypothetical protein
MEIQEQAHAGVFHAFGHGEGVRQVAVTFPAVAVLIGGLHENPEADVVKAMVLEDLENVLLRAMVAVLYSARLGGWNGGNIRPDYEAGLPWRRLADLAADARQASAHAARQSGGGQERESEMKPAEWMCSLHDLENSITHRSRQSNSDMRSPNCQDMVEWNQVQAAGPKPGSLPTANAPGGVGIYRSS